MAAAKIRSALAQAGAVFSDMTRQLQSGLWRNAAAEQGQGLGHPTAAVADLLARVSENLGEPMVGINISTLDASELLQTRGW